MQRLAIIDLNHRHLDLRVQPASRLSWDTSFSHHQARGKDFNLHYVVSGRIEFIRDTHPSTAEAGDLIVSFPGDVIDYCLHGPITVLHCHFSFSKIPLRVISEDLSEWAAGVTAANHGFESHLFLPDHVALHDQSEAVRLLEELPRLHAPGMPTGAVLATATLLRMLSFVSQNAFHQLERRTSPSATAGRHDHVRAALSYISEHVHEPLAVHEIATVLGIDADYLGRLCKQALGVSLGTWIMRARMAKARQLLAESTRSIKEIAHAVGYADPLYFARVFRREMQTTPRDWRSQLHRSGRDLEHDRLP